MRFFGESKRSSRGNKKELMKKLNQSDRGTLGELRSRFSIWDDSRDTDISKKKKEFVPIKNNEEKFVLASPGADSWQARAKATRARHEADFKLNDTVELDATTSAEMREIEAKIGYSFKNPSLLSTAFTHRSALGQNNRVDYERLEFLGDAVLDLVVAQLLCEYHTQAQEGELSKMRAALVNTQNLASFAKDLGFSSHVKLGRGEFTNGGANRPSILADVVEATVGAVFSDGGYSAAFNMIKHILGDSIRQVVPSDPKTELQEALHSAGSDSPQYLLKCVEGPEHSPNFITVVLVDGDVVGFGNGSTKKASQQEAAAFALSRVIPNAASIPLKKGQTEVIADLLNCSCACNCTPEEAEVGKLQRELS